MSDDGENNIIDFDEQTKRIRNLKKKEHKDKKPPREPLFNLPPMVKILTGLIILCYIALEVWENFDPNIKSDAYRMFAFIPLQWSDMHYFSWHTPFSLLTYNFMHGGILHLIMNSVMLLAFGTGAEKFLGAKRFIVIFFLSSVAGVAFHFVFHIGSISPVIGASAGLSGLFGALIVVMMDKGMLPMGKNGIWPFVIIWVIVSVLFGSMGSPDGGTIAWIAHLGGFFAGLGLIQLNWFRFP